MNEARQPSVLFVDDEPPVLSLLQTLFRQAKPDWHCSYTDRGAKALTLMETRPFDIVVSDMRMPEMSGAQLLENIRDRFPRTARVILSGYADPPMSVRSLNAAHQFLAKPFNLAGLQSTLDRIVGAGRYVTDPILRQTLGAIHLLPTAPSISERFDHDVISPAASSTSLAGLFAQDVALTAKLLQLVHSAFFGKPRPLVLARECADALGTKLLRQLAASGHLVLTPDTPQLGGLDVDALARHCVATGLRATRIMSVEKSTPDGVKLAFTGGILHGIGRLALALSYPEKHAEVVQRVSAGEIGLLQAETEVFGAHHAQAGAYLLGLWGLPQSLTDLVANIYEPSASSIRFFSPLTALHVAQHLEASSLPLPEPFRQPLDEEHLAALHMDQRRVNGWAEATQPRR